MNSELSIELENIQSALDQAAKYGLQGEVVWSALSGLKENPEWTILEAISYGYGEWIK